MLETNNEIYEDSDVKQAEDKKLEIEAMDLDREIKLKTVINKEKLNPDAEKLIDELKILISDTTHKFMAEFDRLLSECAEEKEGVTGVTEKIFWYIKDKNLDKPEFIISAGDEAREILNDFGLNYTFYEGDILLALQLPKQLAEYWWKGEKKLKESGSGEKIIKWEYFYKQLRPIIWEQVETFETKRRIVFNRINEVAQHDPKKYYYVWQVERKKGKQEKLEVVEFN